MTSPHVIRAVNPSLAEVGYLAPRDGPGYPAAEVASLQREGYRIVGAYSVFTAGAA